MSVHWGGVGPGHVSRSTSVLLSTTSLNALLREDGSFVLREDGSFILREDPISSPLALGANLSIPNWYTYTPAFMDTAYSAPGNTANENGGFIGSTTGNPIPDANRDASGNPKSLPGGDAGIAFSNQLPTTLGQRKLTWQSALGGSNHGCATMALSGAGGTGVVVDLVNRSVTYTPVSVADGSASNQPSFVYTPVSSTDYPINFIDRPVVDSGAVLTPEFTSLIPQACSANPVIRLLDWVTVNRNNSPIWLGSSAQPATSVAGKTISSITFVGTLATVTTSTVHGLLGNGTGSASASITVTGATPSTYNVADAYVKVISPTQFQYTMAGTPAGNASVMGSYVVGDADFQFTNLHYPVTANEPGVQFGEPIYTSTNRNKNKADAEWHDGVMLESIVSMLTQLGGSPYYPVAPNADSTFQSDVATVLAAYAQSSGKPVYMSVGNEHWNSSFKWFHQLRNEANLRGTLGDALTACRLIATSNIGLSGLAAIDGITPSAGDRILVTAQSTASQNGVYVAAAGAWSRAADTLAYRDIWLVTGGLSWAQTSWFISTQGAIVAGTTALTIAQINSHMRYAEKVIEVANAFRTAFTSAGVSSLLNVIAEYQNAGSISVWDDMVSFVGPTDWAKVTHTSVGAYYGDNGPMGIAVGFTGPNSTLKAAMSTDIDNTITNVVSHLNKAISLGKKLIIYEGGNTVNLSDATYKASWARSSDAYDMELRFLQQMELRAASLQTGGLINNQYNLSFPFAGSNFSWGLIEGLTQTRSKATTPKLQAHTDFLAGVRVLSAATGTLGTVSANPANGTALGTVSRTVYGSTWSLADNDGGRAAIDANGNVTVLDGTLLGVAGTRNVTVRESFAGDPVGHVDTVKSYSVAAAYRYYRLRTTATPAVSGVAFAELIGSTSPGGTNQFLSKTVSATSTFGDGPAPNGVDGNTATFWDSDFGGTWPQDFIVDLGVGNALAIAEFRVIARTGSQSNQAPGDFTFSGSPDNVTYTTLKTLTGQTFVSGETKVYSVP